MHGQQNRVVLDAHAKCGHQYYATSGLLPNLDGGLVIGRNGLEEVAAQRLSQIFTLFLLAAIVRPWSSCLAIEPVVCCKFDRLYHQLPVLNIGPDDVSRLSSVPVQALISARQLAMNGYLQIGLCVKLLRRSEHNHRCLDRSQSRQRNYLGVPAARRGHQMTPVDEDPPFLFLRELLLLFFLRTSFLRGPSISSRSIPSLPKSGKRGTIT